MTPSLYAPTAPTGPAPLRGNQMLEQQLWRGTSLFTVQESLGACRTTVCSRLIELLLSRRQRVYCCDSPQLLRRTFENEPGVVMAYLVYNTNGQLSTLLSMNTTGIQPSMV